MTQIVSKAKEACPSDFIGQEWYIVPKFDAISRLRY